jgi:acyl carrier protein
MAAKLPDYMMPAHIVLMDQFPLTRNGKIDKKALPDPESSESHTELHEDAETETEKALSAIWINLLELESISLNDNFFNVGGDSLLAVRLISLIRKEMGVEVRISDLFEHPTVKSLAAHLAIPSIDNVLPPITAHPRPADIPLSFSQERLWFIDRLQGSVPYHIPAVLRLKGKLDIAAMNYALQMLVNRHEVLRTVIREKDGQGYQYILEKDGLKIDVIDGKPYSNDVDKLRSLVNKLITAPFDLAKDHMLRASLITLTEEEFMLVVTMHHIASDGWSLSILVNDVVELYSSYNEGSVSQLSFPADTICRLCIVAANTTTRKNFRTEIRLLEK